MVPAIGHLALHYVWYVFATLFLAQTYHEHAFDLDALVVGVCHLCFGFLPPLDLYECKA
jgi:hypothetical protein